MTTQSGPYYSNRGRVQGNRGRGSRGRGQFSTRGRGFHQQVSSFNGSSTTSSETDKEVQCQIYGKIGHLAISCWHRFNNSYQYEHLPQASTALRITKMSDGNGQEWFPDSGATAHVTNSPINLQHATPYHGSDTVMVGNGSFLPITHTGSTSIASSGGNQDASASGTKPK